MSDFDLVLLLRICGITACIASFTVLIADLLLTGGPLQPNEPSPTYRLLKKPEVSVFWGHSLDVRAIPFCLAGLVLVSYGLWPIGIWLSLAITVGLASLFVLGPFAHGLVAPGGLILRAQADGKIDQASVDQIMAKLRRYIGAPALPFFAIFMMASVALSVVVLVGNTRLPAWLGLWCLGPLMLVCMRSYSFLPARLAGFLGPTCVHIVYLPFITAVTWLLWDG